MAQKKNVPAKPSQTAKTQPQVKKEKKSLSFPGAAHLPYLLGFILLWIFCSAIYGDVFVRAEQDSFFTFDPLPMDYVVSQPLGHAYWAARFLLLSYKSAWLGGLLLALILTATARLADSAFGTPWRMRGISFLLPIAVLAYFVYRGTNIYHKNEPGIIFLLPVVVLAVTAILAGIACLIRSKRQKSHEPEEKPRRLFSPGIITLTAASAILYGCTLHFNENEILTARLHNLADEGKWEEITEEALSACRPTRTVAAYYTMALVQTNQLLEKIFDLPFDYPEARLDKIEGNSEYSLFLPDANFYAGLTLPAYHAAQELVVMNGPRLHKLKRMAISAIMNKEPELAKKLLHVIEQTPFEDSFVEKYRPMISDSTLIAADPILGRVLKLAPMENKFEQNYRTPAFLGYNMGLRSGSDPTLVTSVAACLYTKDLDNMLMRTSILRTKQHLPPCVQQAIVIASLKRDGLMQQYPEISPYVQETVKSFIMEAKPYAKDKPLLREKMKEKWLGTYMYYYYCENNETNQQKQSTTDAAVN